MASTGASELPRLAAETTSSEMELGPETGMELPRAEVLWRRRTNAGQLAKFYWNKYWALIEEVRVQHRDYYWEYGKSPFEDEDYGGGDDESPSAVGPFRGESEEEKAGLGFCVELEKKKGERSRCVFAGCKSKAMPLCRFCHSHILSDNLQTLYKGCIHVIKNPSTGRIYCQKPVLRSTIPLLCPVHYQKHQKTITQALRKAGLNVSTTNRPAPKIHVIIAEYVNQIQDKRRRLS